MKKGTDEFLNLILEELGKWEWDTRNTPGPTLLEVQTNNDNRDVVFAFDGETLSIIIHLKDGEEDLPIYEEHILALLTQIMGTPKIFENLYPDTDAVSWQIEMGNSFHGVPDKYDWMLTKAEINPEEKEESVTHFISLTLTDVAS